MTRSYPENQRTPPIALQGAYQLRRSGHCELAFCWQGKVFNHYGYSWGCKHHHSERMGARDCAVGEIARIKGASYTQSISEAIAVELNQFGGVLRCQKCQTEQGVGDIAEGLREGWPKHCGYTMTWVTQRMLDEARNGV